MKINQAEFVTSVASADKFLKTDKPIIAVAGKSNVGKSSLINMLANRKKLAKTSVTPGRTRLINYFDFGEFMLADLPGYGFAKVSKEEKKKWGALLESFLSTQKIVLLLSLVDIRHDPTADDKMMINYLYHYQVPFALVATKADKLGKTKIKPRIKEIATDLRVGFADVTASSAETGYGKDDILRIIEQAISVDSLEE
ncbi:MAG: YihA family ribosome biogenesis GTP-binding protein [Clostridia bacterium]|nr:YihA family ribosome biogenesis GTP-binding protein [Clostridia bacterium]MBR2449301.1 YihA family ribosome biogenesis GTP-binding protein [Clostridia bacterium]